MELTFINIRFFKTCLAISIIVFGVSAWQCFRFMEVDSCLDAGGRYNYETSKCDCSDPTYMTPIQRAPIRTLSMIFTLSLLLSVVVFILSYLFIKYIVGGLPNQALKLTK